MTPSHWLLILFWALYGFMHSWLASIKVKNQAQKLLKSGYKYYRLAYNLLASIGLVGLLVWGALMDDPRIWTQSTILTFLSLMFATYGVIVIRLSFKQFSIGEFLGFSVLNENKRQPVLRKQGLLHFVRHPIYSGTLLITIGFVLYAPSLTNFIHAACIAVYILIGVKYEELKLVEEFGEAYMEYKKKVPMLIPKIPWWK
ncbi:MAG: methyltransferase family protein [Cyclobacteriaceae bacterium]